MWREDEDVRMARGELGSRRQSAGCSGRGWLRTVEAWRGLRRYGNGCERTVTVGEGEYVELTTEEWNLIKVQSTCMHHARKTY